MTNYKTFNLLLLSSLAVFGCKTTKPIIDTNEAIDFSQISSCYLPETEPSSEENPILLKLTHHSIAKHVQQTNLAISTQDSECKIAYHLTYQDKPNHSSVNFSVGTSHQSKNSAIGIGVGKTIDLPSSSVILTSIHITFSFQGVPAWYAKSTFENELDLNTEIRKQRIDNVIGQMFDYYPTAINTTGDK